MSVLRCGRADEAMRWHGIMVKGWIQSLVQLRDKSEGCIVDFSPLPWQRAFSQKLGDLCQYSFKNGRTSLSCSFIVLLLQSSVCGCTSRHRSLSLRWKWLLSFFHVTVQSFYPDNYVSLYHSGKTVKCCPATIQTACTAFIKRKRQKNNLKRLYQQPVWSHKCFNGEVCCCPRPLAKHVSAQSQRDAKAKKNKLNQS